MNLVLAQNVFIYVCMYLRGSESKRALGSSPKCPQWPGPKMGARNSIRSSTMSGRNPSSSAVLAASQGLQWWRAGARGEANPGCQANAHPRLCCFLGLMASLKSRVKLKRTKNKISPRHQLLPPPMDRTNRKRKRGSTCEGQSRLQA